MSHNATHDAEGHHAMDYGQHEAMWGNFVALIKWSIYLLAITVLSLYAFIQLVNPVLGFVLLIVGLLSIPAYMLFRPKR